MNEGCDHAFFHDKGYKICPSCSSNLGSSIKYDQERYAEKLATYLRKKYILTYKCSVNLQGVINNLLTCHLTEKQVEDVVEDIISNIEFVVEFTNDM